MRNRLSRLIANEAIADPEFLVLSGDHGYALFNEVREARPQQFLNAGVAEQGMVGLAAGLAQQGFRPLVYGLASFVPIRVLEQIKLDLCFSKRRVVLIGDGAGLVYSTLGASHQCGEDLASLRALPHLAIFAPADAEELEVCFREAMRWDGPSYVRVGKSDRPEVHVEPLRAADPHWISESPDKSACLVACGSMLAPAVNAARALSLGCLSIPRIKPLTPDLLRMLSNFERIIVLEEHSRHGGLTSALLDLFSEFADKIPLIRGITLGDKFSKLCGGYQYALSEHGLSDPEIIPRVQALLT